MSDQQKKDPFDGEYVGNIWGWNFSLFGLFLILFFLGVIVYRHYVMSAPIGMEDPLIEKTEKLKSDTSAHKQQ